MEKLNAILEMWKKDAQVDRTEPGRELINIPILHSKYLNILSQNRMLAKKCESEYNKMKKIKWEYYTGKLDDVQLRKYGWEPFPFTLKSEIDTYFNSDSDLIKIKNLKNEHDEIVEVCTSILKELNSRTFQLRDFIQWERFIQGS